MRIEKLDDSTKKNLLEDLLKRSPNSYGKYEQSVREILDAVRERKDEALFDYTEKFDGVRLDASTILVTEEEIEEAYREVGEELLGVIRRALKNIESYHAKQMQYSWFDSRPDGTILGQKVTALQRVGVYVPGGKAAYPSSVLMNILPAKVAGVDEIIRTTPPGKEDVYKRQDADHSDYVSLLKKLRAIPGVKKVFIRSGIRFDYLLADKKQDFLRERCEDVYKRQKLMMKTGLGLLQNEIRYRASLSEIFSARRRSAVTLAPIG